MRNGKPESLAGIPGKHLHIVGCSPRSGTTLLHELIVSCFEIDEKCDHEESAYKVFSSPTSVYCSKNPNEAPALRYLLAINPNFYAIFLLRDPRDVIVSKHNKEKNLYFSNLRVWKEYVRFAKKLEGHERFLVVRYEDLVSSPDKTQALLVRKFPFLRVVKPFSAFHAGTSVSRDSEVALGGVREVKPTSVGRWREHQQRVADQMAVHGDISRALVAFGYEDSPEWRGSLPEPSAEPVRSFIPEKVGFVKRLKRWSSWIRKSFFYFLRVSHPGVYRLVEKLKNANRGR